MFGFILSALGLEKPPRRSVSVPELQAALLANAAGGTTLLLDRRDTSFVGSTVDPPGYQYDDPDAEEAIDAIRSVPVHYALDTLTSTFSTGVQWSAGNDIPGGLYSQISNAGNITKRCTQGTAEANTDSEGADQFFSFQQSISAGSSATIDLQAMTNILAQATQSIARAKCFQFRLLSAADDSTITPAPNAASTCVVTNYGNIAVPAQLDWGTGGTGLTLTCIATAGPITSASICTAGTGYPRSSTFMVAPNNTGGSGAAISINTNAAGIPQNTLAVIAAGAGYTNNVPNPTTVLGFTRLGTGDAKMFVSPSAGGLNVTSTTKNVLIHNNDTVNAITVEVDVVGGET